MNEWYRRAGSAGRAGFDVAIGPREAGWEHAGLYVVTLAPGESRSIAGGEHEWLVLPLSGRVRVECADKLVLLAGREGPFAGPTDYAYVPVSSRFTITSPAGARVALPHAKASKALPFRRIPAEETIVELRGAGHFSRQVNNFATPSVLDADSIIACEVLTPAGNWSSYPPHKHDEHLQDRESILQEIYYFEIRAEEGAPPSANPYGYQRVYGTKDRPINVLAEVRTGDVVLVPHGWHGPAMAPPGYDMYYLNVMAGPGEEREWRVSEDPDHAWVAQKWAAQKVDPRLPFGARR
ncbi:MAG: 5-deoxy-glucuronate isomerase [Dermatophilaceae bacterium]